MDSERLAELEEELASLKTTLSITIVKEWQTNRKETVRLLRALADEIQKHEDNSRIATLSGASASIAGTSLAIGGAVAAFFTFGASLLLTIVGSSIAGVGAATVVGTQITNKILQSSNAQLVENALKVDKEKSAILKDQFAKVQETLDKIKSLSPAKGAVEMGKLGCSVGSSIHKGVIQQGIQLGKLGGEAGETAFKALGNSARALHVAGIAVAAITLVVDIYTVVSTSVEVHNGSILEVVKDIRKLAQDLEDEMNSVMTQIGKLD